MESFDPEGVLLLSCVMVSYTWLGALYNKRANVTGLHSLSGGKLEGSGIDN